MTDTALPATTAAATPKTRSFSFSKIRHSFVFRSVLASVFTIWLSVTFNFALIRLLPSSPIQIYIEGLMRRQEMTLESAQAKAAQMFSTDVNAPIFQQYLTYVGNILRGNLGESIVSPGTTVLSIIGTVLPWTLFSVGLGLLLSFIIGLGLGLLTAYWRGSPFDVVVTTIAKFFSAVPDYLIAVLLLVVGGTQLHLFSVGQMRGAVSPGIEPGFTLKFIGDVLMHASLPVFTYLLSTVGTWLIIMKKSTVGTLGEEYVTVANARGLGRGRIMTAYVGRNAMLPMVTQLSLRIAAAVGGSVVIEYYWAYPGVGQRLVDGITQRDYTTIQGLFFMITTSIVIANLLTDLLYGRLDPRVRVGN